jgi:AcrR family transcriptional regulator
MAFWASVALRSGRYRARVADPTPARERVLRAAEELFARHGFAGVTMRDIAQRLGIRQASLYYHAPDGKQDLYVQVVEHSMRRHRLAMERAVADAGDLRDALTAAADWLLGQPLVDLFRMVRSDMAAAGPEQADRLRGLAYTALMEPLRDAFDAAIARGEARPVDPLLMAGTFLATIESIDYAVHAEGATRPAREMACEMIDVWLGGLAASGRSADATPG